MDNNKSGSAMVKGKAKKEGLPIRQQIIGGGPLGYMVVVRCDTMEIKLVTEYFASQKGIQFYLKV